MTSIYRRLNAAGVIVLLIAATGGGVACRSALASWWTRITASPGAAAAPISSPELAANEKDAVTLRLPRRPHWTFRAR